MYRHNHFSILLSELQEYHHLKKMVAPLFPLSFCQFSLYSSLWESKMHMLIPGAAAGQQWIRELMMDDWSAWVCVHACVKEDSPCIILSGTPSCCEEARDDDGHGKEVNSLHAPWQA